MTPFDPALIRPTEPALFYTRNDPNDPRLGEVVRNDDSGYADADVAILGCPQDEGVRRNGGRVGAARAPAEIRRYLYRFAVGGLEPLRIADVGDVVAQPALEATHDLHQAVIERLLRDGKRAIVLGGGNDIAFPDCAAVAQVFGDVTAFNIDAHFDVRADVPRNSGTPYRQLLEGNHIAPERFHEIGYQPFANSRVYERYLRDRGVRRVSLRELRERGVEATLRPLLPAPAPVFQALFWGIDLDAVRASDAPGVSAPNPFGLTGEELCDIAGIAGAHPDTRLVEFSEVNPEFDIDGRTCRLTAAAIWYCLAGMRASLGR